ncbi:MAG: primosomal protein N', partial [Candidatus Saccharibacteria bacterium]
MYYYEVAPNQIVRQGSMFFTYSSDYELSIGQIVTIPVGKKTMIGVVLRATKQPSYETKPIISLVEETPLPNPLVELANWLSDYYVAHLATVFQTILPSGIQKTRRQKELSFRKNRRDRTNIVFTKDQEKALKTIENMTPGSALLHGVTGSGKTAVYIEMAKRALARNDSVIILVPEIALTSQLVDEFSHHFEDVILAHSRQTESERHIIWRDALGSEKPRVVIGPRSALFLPLRHVGLIVIDEAHEPSFKQEQSPRYSALRAASILAKNHGAKLIMGSATPSISEYYLAEKSGRPIITMAETAKQSSKPIISLIDMTKRQNFKEHRFLSDKLLSQLDETFAAGNQALIFHNRRGSASTTLCENCGWQAMCPRCFVPLTLHADNHHLRCHICGFNDKVPTSCPECHHANIVHRGIGTKMIETELRKIYPDKTIMRFDGDSETTETVEQKYSELYDGTIDLIIGTQVIAKGLDLPKLRTVGVVQADSGLSLPDFGASERTFQLLAQVVGRVGRSHHATQVIVQSYQPTHQSVICG